jgi:hypothetical protein
VAHGFGHGEKSIKVGLARRAGSGFLILGPLAAGVRSCRGEDFQKQVREFKPSSLRFEDGGIGLKWVKNDPATLTGQAILSF